MARKTKRPDRPGRSNKKGGSFWPIIITAFITFAAGLVLVIVLRDRLFPPKKPAKATHGITIYMSSVDGKGLKGEKLSIEKGPIASEIKSAVETLIEESGKDPEHTIPEGTKLLSVKIENSIAYVNMSKEFSLNHPGGSSAEILSIYAVVNTLTLNFPEVKKVQLLIEGKIQDTLAGHIVIGIPLGPDRKLIKG